MLRDWSLITRRGGGATKWKWGGACEVLPLRKGEKEKVLALLKWGGGAQHVLPCLEGGAKCFGQFSHFVAPLPIINDQSFIRPWADRGLVLEADVHPINLCSNQKVKFKLKHTILSKIINSPYHRAVRL